MIIPEPINPIQSIVVDPTRHFTKKFGLEAYYEPSTVQCMLFNDFTDDATLLIDWLNDPSLAHLDFLGVVLQMLPEYGGEFSPVYPENFDIKSGTFGIGPQEGGKTYSPKLILERTDPHSETGDPERIFVYEDNVVGIVDDVSNTYKLYELD